MIKEGRKNIFVAWAMSLSLIGMFVVIILKDEELQNQINENLLQGQQLAVCSQCCKLQEKIK